MHATQTRLDATTLLVDNASSTPDRHTGAGMVLDVGPGVAGFAPGDRVAWTGVCGVHVPEARAITIPAGLDLPAVAAALVPSLAAHYLAHDTYPAKPGETVVVHADGAGAMLVPMLAARGVRVLATTSTVDTPMPGADAVIRRDEVADIAAMVHELTGGEGAHAGYNGNGAETFDADLACLRARGTLVLYGETSGPVPPIDVARLGWGGSLTLVRTCLEHYVTGGDFARRASALFGRLLEEGRGRG